MGWDRMDVLVLLRKEACEADLEFQREGLRVVLQQVWGPVHSDSSAAMRTVKR